MKSIMQDDWETCYLCGRRASETHHVLGGTANRRLSEKYGLTVRLCPNCHRGTDGAQYNRELNFRLKAEAQMAFEVLYGHEKWMSVFRRNYITEGVEGYDTV